MPQRVRVRVRVLELSAQHNPHAGGEIVAFQRGSGGCLHRGFGKPCSGKKGKPTPQKRKQVNGSAAYRAVNSLLPQGNESVWKHRIKLECSGGETGSRGVGGRLEVSTVEVSTAHVTISRQTTKD